MNGVQQVSWLSLSLFAVYMDALSSLLNTSRMSVCDVHVCFNHVFCADDLFVITSSLYNSSSRIK